MVVTGTLHWFSLHSNNAVSSYIFKSSQIIFALIWKRSADVIWNKQPTPDLLLIWLFTYGLVLAALTEYAVHYSVNSHAKDDMSVKLRQSIFKEWTTPNHHKECIYFDLILLFLDIKTAKTINVLMNLLNMSIINWSHNLNTVFLKLFFFFFCYVLFELLEFNLGIQHVRTGKTCHLANKKVREIKVQSGPIM